MAEKSVSDRFFRVRLAAWFSGRLGGEASEFPVSFAAFAPIEAKCERAINVELD